MLQQVKSKNSFWQKILMLNTLFKKRIIIIKEM